MCSLVYPYQFQVNDLHSWTKQAGERTLCPWKHPDLQHKDSWGADQEPQCSQTTETESKDNKNLNGVTPLPILGNDGK